jgi:hypothetical protein
MSALDLFASALGAFILVTIVLLPYYLKHEDVVNDNNQLRQKIAEIESTAANTAAELKKSKAKEASAKAALKKLQKESKNAGGLENQLKQAKERAAEAEQKAAASEQKAAAASKSVTSSKKALNRAEAEIKRRVKFALLGLATNAETFVLVMDMSSSMKRFQGITLETMRKIFEPLTSREKVGIIGFHAPGSRAFHTIRLRHWLSPGNIIPMSNQNKNIAMSFVRQMMRQVDGGTPTMAGLLEALKYNVDAIILLSDGAPTVPNRDWQNVINTVTRQNRGKKEIHTVAVGNFYERPTFVRFLSQLARANKGRFTGVALP